MGRRSRRRSVPLTGQGAGYVVEQRLVDEQRAGARDGRRQAYQDAYEQAQARAQTRRERPRGPWRQRGARIVRAQVSDEEWQKLAAQAAAHGQSASVYLGALIRGQLVEPQS